jgi:hypothetical protein
VKIGKTATFNGTSKLVFTFKRKHKAAPVDWIDQDTPKRRKTHVESGDKEHANPPPKFPAQTDVIEPNDAADEPTPRRIFQKLNNLSEQVHWVEQCHRVADEAHDNREDTWRTSSATFHDHVRQARERHETWIANEMAWQRNMLLNLSNEIKGLYPLNHSLKWKRLDGLTSLQLTENRWETQPNNLPSATTPYCHSNSIQPMPLPAQSQATSTTKGEATMKTGGQA